MAAFGFAFALAMACLPGMSVSADEEEEYYADISAVQEEIEAKPGEEVTLKTKLDTNVAEENLHFKWSIQISEEDEDNEEDNWETIEGATGQNYTIQNPQTATYCCELTYDVVDEDEKKEEEYGGEAYFYVTIDNNLSVKVASTELSVKPGGSVTLKATATADITEGLTYEWYQEVDDEDSDDILVGTGAKLTLSNVTKNNYYYVVVTDCYGNEKSGDEGVEVTIDNNLSVYITSGSDNYNDPKVKYGGSVTLKAHVTANNKNGLVYAWYREADDDDDVKIGTGATITIKEIKKSGWYYVEVTDCYGNENTDWIKITVYKPIKTTKTEKGITYKISNNKATVTKCKKAKTAKIPATIKMNGKKVKVTAIAANAFKGNKKLTSVTIGKNVKTIGKNAFYGCEKLEKVTIGKNVKTIGKKAFYRCKKLKNVIIQSKSLKKIGSAAFKKAGAKKLTVKVPAKKKKAYKKKLKKAGLKKTAKVK